MVLLQFLGSSKQHFRTKPFAKIQTKRSSFRKFSILKLLIIGFISSGFGFKWFNLTGLGGFLPILF
jgi:hypothetical protein